jgi:23S rRNA (cytidine2498-2'-O)-methyltransferase
MTARYIVTATPELASSALGELRRIAGNVRKAAEFADGVFLVETEAAADDFTRALVGADPVFVKHIMPVQADEALAGRRDADLPAILEAVRRVCTLGAGEPFAVQCRCVAADSDYGAKDVEVFVGSFLEEHGAVPVFSDIEVAAAGTQKVVSVYVFRAAGYVGCSTVAENLNEHCDEFRVVSRRQGREVSRAEFKLREAVRKFGLELAGGRALDLGAAPGGWTKVLADAGMEVVAVDPAALDERVATLANVMHAAVRAEDYVPDGPFDLLVNDMNTSPEDSARLMVAMAPHLRPGAFAVMTVKLVIRHPQRLLDNVAGILAGTYATLRIKNLFHNRREVTALLRKL